MLKTPAIYRGEAETYLADTCMPVRRAVAEGRLEQVALARGTYPGRTLASGHLPGVKSVGYWNAPHDQDWGLPWHRNEGIEITLIETGNLYFAVEDQAHLLQADDLTITRPWQPHRLGNPHVTANCLHCLILDVGVRRPHQAWKWPRWLVLTDTDRRELTDMLRHNEQPVWHSAGEIRLCFRRIAQAVKDDRGGSSVSRLAALLNELFVLLLDMFRHHKIPLNQSLSSTARTVELFLGDLTQSSTHLAQCWTVDSMAKQCGLGSTRFIHYCKQLTNMTPAQYLNRSRVEMAAKLLLDEPDSPVTRIALACGFSSSQYFATVFRRQFGCTPGQFRSSAAK